MAGAGEEELEYESDPEEAKLSLKMRRREASDDEEDSEEGKESEIRGKPPRRIDSEGDSEGEGAAAEYDDEEEGSEIDEDDEEEYVEEEEEYEDGGGEGTGEGGGAVKAVALEEEELKERLAERAEGESSAEHQGVIDNGNNNEQREEEKKENEPYAVPTAGAFYMHDDRFRENAGARHRRTFGGRKLWESKDDRKWGHDKFEEMTMEERHYEEGRRASRGRYRGRGRGRGADRGYPRGRRLKAYNDENNQSDNNFQKNQSNAPKGVRGRGPRKYRPTFKDNIETPAPQNNQSGRSVEKPSHGSSGKLSAQISNAESDAIQSGKQVFVSSLSSASPPFYPSGSSTKEITLTHKRDVQAGTGNRTVQPSLVVESSTTGQPTQMLRGKTVLDSIGMDKLNIDDSVSVVAGKPSTSMQFPSSMNSSQSQQLRAQGRGVPALPQMAYQPTTANNQVNRAALPTPVHSMPRNPVQGRVQPSSQASGQQFAPRSGSGSQGSSPPKTPPNMSSFEAGEVESSSESSKLKSALVGKGKSSVQTSGRGSILYGGAQVIGSQGNMGGAHGDQNFSATPAFLPVMQFGGQHNGGIGVPAVGMAFPGYVTQPQLGLGNSEMTWLPVLAGAAGALGATYCSPYITVDGAYHARPSGQISTLAAASSKETSTSRPNNDWKSSQRPELSNDDFGQRQKNPRRYTEMKFDQ